ncbi:thioesterase domain-containing protein [Kutzneria kofuensis]|uniref:Thioesterase domain-containing protein n=1 Tax=Kutzneria kofuensis TaxID=103725 RepID=A0A7W9KRD8_9PSEU|nr:thioesterase domain-containing protein [Kutzneria kofuensis]MBB5897235.1 thioesterase domain-containing protein [Kutzneria kofuensis]
MIVYKAGGVRIDLVRAGSAGTLVLVPGLEGDPDELAGVIAGYTGPESVYCAAPMLVDDDGEAIETVERMAELMVAALDEVLGGSYDLGGYSFGGLIAWEMAQRLKADGRAPAHVFLIEAIYDERFWSRRLWLTAMRRRGLNQLARISQLPPRQAAAEFGRRGQRLLRRFARRSSGGDATSVSSGETDAGRRAYRAMPRYRPAYYDGAVTVLAATDNRHFGCDTAECWQGLARETRVRRVVGDHLTIVGEPDAAAAVADGIGRDLNRASGVRPSPGYERVLIVSTMRWFSAARLADAMIESGFTVSVCHPSGHPLEVVDGLAGDHQLHKWMPLRSIARAMRAAKPDLVMCDDERSLVLLRRLHTRQPHDEVLARSLGEWTRMISRAGVAEIARDAGVDVPETAVVTDPSALRSWTPPVVLKTDGSSGGRGVAVVAEPASLERAWRDISRPPAPHVAVKRALVNRELHSLTATVLRRRPTVNVQQFRAGTDAIATVACRDGEVIALVCLEVVLAEEVRGPSAVVRVIDHAGMAEAARRIVRRFRLSGFCGLDFVVDAAGTAWFVELNARVTPTCHLLFDAPRPLGQVLALFPYEHGSPAYADCVDVPVRAPRLAERGQKLLARQQHPILRRVRGWTSRPRPELPA